jgi:hypothetical protein
MYRLVLGEPGRGIQFRVGASETTRDVLLFASRRLAAPECGHADSECYGGELRWWNFCLRYPRDDLLGRWLEILAPVYRRLGRYYGDPRIFARRDIYEAGGGFPWFPIMEDVVSVRRIEGAGRQSTCRGP